MRVLDAVEHDRALALTSHLPHLVSSALAGTVPAELIDLTATGFRDATRLAAGCPDVWTPIFDANREALLAALDAYRDRLDLYRRALASGDRAAIEKLLTEGKQRRDELPGRGANSDRELKSCEPAAPSKDEPLVLAWRCGLAGCYFATPQISCPTRMAGAELSGSA